MSVAVTEKNITSEVVSWIERDLSAKTSAADLRKEGLSYFQKLGFPVNKAEEFKHTPITRTLEKNFSFTLGNPVAKDLDLKSFSIPALDANVVVFINGIFSKQHSSIISPETEITILSLEEALAKKNAVVLQHLAKHAD